MKASTSGELFQSSSFKELALRYAIQTIVNTPQSDYYFSKFEILRQPELLFEVAEAMVGSLGSDVSRICALAASGVPIATAISLISKLPLMFFYRAGYAKSDRASIKYRFMPNANFSGSIALVDSHIRTGYTGALAVDELNNNAFDISQIMVPYVFDNCVINGHIRDIVYVCLDKYSSSSSQLAAAIDIPLVELDQSIAGETSTFWNIPETYSSHNSYFEKLKPGIRAKVIGLLSRKSFNHLVEPLADTNSARYNPPTAKYGFDDWSLFLEPQSIERLAIDIGTKLNIEDYDYLLGVDHLGLATAIAVAFYNREKFSGSIIAHLRRPKLLPNNPSLENKRVLPIQLRFENSLLQFDVFRRVQSLGGHIDKYVTIFQPNRNLYFGAFDKITKDGVQCLYLN